ncbi:hypothetical protein F383_27352 [Gossypium arboreum]|uniref:Uncharacterized protein n=1 Tax=Gossypium arboreum TaxID=29729 RepID=A0A0B0PAF2_GOSAR|nr:hypothetical protein F383_27352 [Gossypium arboreum]
MYALFPHGLRHGRVY